MAKRWSDLGERSRRLIVAAAIGEAALKTAVLIDIRRRPASQIRGSKRMWIIAVVLVNSAGVGPLSYFALGGDGSPDPTPREGSGRSRATAYRGPAANAVLTTVVDTWGRAWTPGCPSRSSGLLRRTATDSRGPGHSPEKREADCSAAVSAANNARLSSAVRCRIRPYWIKAAPLRGAAGSASAPRSASEGTRGARRAAAARVRQISTAHPPRRPDACSWTLSPGRVRSQQRDARPVDATLPDADQGANQWPPRG